MELSEYLKEKIYNKRFGVQENGGFYHVAVAMKGSIENPNILGFGLKYYPNNYFTVVNPYTIHAEHDLINNLPFTRKKNRIKIFVGRFSKSSKLCMSKPCKFCINKMVTLYVKKGYLITDVYYSDENGLLIKTTVGRLYDAQK